MVAAQVSAMILPQRMAITARGGAVSMFSGSEYTRRRHHQHNHHHLCRHIEPSILRSPARLGGAIMVLGEARFIEFSVCTEAKGQSNRQQATSNRSSFRANGSQSGDCHRPHASLSDKEKESSVGSATA